MESVQKQTLSPNEIIIINDGSTDATSLILEDYKDQPNCKIVNTENRGLGPARNLGASLSRSDYLMFLDSDDYIKNDLIADFTEIYKKHPELDVFAFSFRAFDDITGKSLPNHSHIYSQMKNDNGKNMLADLIKNESFHSSACAMIIRRDLLDWKKNGFVNILHEDEEFTPRLFALSSMIYLSEKQYYNYRKARKNSIMDSSGFMKFMRSRIGYAFSLFSCFRLLIENMQHKRLAFALLRRVRYLSHHAFSPLFLLVPSLLRYALNRYL